MEPEVHVIEKYFQEILHCFTMTNIRLKGGKEIDLLAIEPKSGLKFHVESRVATSPSFRLRLKDTYTSKGRPHRRGIDFFAKEKFNHPIVVKHIQEIFGDTNYVKILVVWDVEEESVVEQAKQNFDIHIILMDSILDVLKERKGVKGYRDDILRTVELMTFWEKEKDVEEFSRRHRRMMSKVECRYDMVKRHGRWMLKGPKKGVEVLMKALAEFMFKKSAQRRFKIKRLAESLLEKRIQLTINGRKSDNLSYVWEEE